MIAERSESFETMMQLGKVRAMAPIWMSICCMGRPARRNSMKIRPYSTAASMLYGQIDNCDKACRKLATFGSR